MDIGKLSCPVLVGELPKLGVETTVTAPRRETSAAITSPG